MVWQAGNRARETSWKAGPLAGPASWNVDWPAGKQ